MALRIEGGRIKSQERSILSSRSNQHLPKPGQYSRDAEQVVKQINAKYDQLMVELKRYKEEKLRIEKSLESDCDEL
jgi:hypothetical protein